MQIVPSAAIETAAAILFAYFAIICEAACLLYVIPTKLTFSDDRYLGADKEYKNALTDAFQANMKPGKRNLIPFD